MKLSMMKNQSERHVNMLSEQLRNKTFSQIEHTANMFLPLNYSASSLARGLSSSLNGTQLPFTAIQSKVNKQISSISFFLFGAFIYSGVCEFDEVARKNLFLVVYRNYFKYCSLSGGENISSMC